MRKISPKLFALLEIASRKDMRVGQLMCCIGKKIQEDGKKIFYTENEELENYIENFLMGEK